MKFAIAIAGAALTLAAAATTPAGAQDIQPGKWEYSVQSNMAGRAMPQIPPDKLAQMPPDVRAKIEQMMQGGQITYSSCITADLPVPKNPRSGDCTVEKLQRQGGTVTWRASCTGRDGRESQAEAKAVYAGDSMTMDMTIRTQSRDGEPMTMRQHVTGRYVGPCAD